MGMVALLPGASVSAATVTVNPGESIQAAITAANPGDVIEVNAGTYTEALNLNTKDGITLRGVGAVTVNTQGTTKGVGIVSGSNITIENFTFNGNSPTTPTATGVDINSSQNITLRNVTTINYGKNGVAVVAQQGASHTPSANISFENVSVVNASWAGIAFYTRSTDGLDANIEGVSFSGVTHVEGTQYGIQFADANSDPSFTVNGPSGQTLDLGVVEFVNNQAHLSNDNTNNPIVISGDSTVDGELINASHIPGVDVEITPASAAQEPAEEQPEDLDGVVPGVPNTGRR